MGQKKAPFTSDQEAILIQEIRGRPLLWDVSHKNYRRTDLKDQHYEEIANILGPSFTGEIVKDRFTNMKTNFGRNHRTTRVSKSKYSGSGAEDMYKTSWALYESFLFLQKSCKHTEGVSNLNLDNQYSTSASSGSLAEAVDSDMYFDENMQCWLTLPLSPVLSSSDNNQQSPDRPSDRPSTIQLLQGLNPLIPHRMIPYLVQ